MDQRSAHKGIQPRAGCARLALAILAGLLSGGTVAAQGFGPDGQVVDWSGPYVGLTLSGNFSDGEADRTLATGFVVETDVSNGLFPGSIGDWQSTAYAGLTLGYNFQRDTLVGGVELNLSALDQEVDYSFSRVDPEILVGVDTITLYGTEIDNLSTLSARAGYAVEDLFIFGRVGVARADVRNDFTIDLTGGGIPLLEFTEDGERWGYTLGVGVERQLNERMSVLAELSYFDLENTTVEARAPTIFPGNELDYTFQNDGFVARIGLNFAF